MIRLLCGADGFHHNVKDRAHSAAWVSRQIVLLEGREQTAVREGSEQRLQRLHANAFGRDLRTLGTEKAHQLFGECHLISFAAHPLRVDGWCTRQLIDTVQKFRKEVTVGFQLIRPVPVRVGKLMTEELVEQLLPRDRDGELDR